MEYFMLLATDGENVYEARMAARPEHLKRLETLKSEGRLLTAGPNPLPEDSNRVSGSLIVAQFESLMRQRRGRKTIPMFMQACTAKC